MLTKRLLALLLTTMLLAGTASGCNSKSSTDASAQAGGATADDGSGLIRGNIYKTGDKILKDKKTYKIVVAKDPNSQNGFADKQCVKDANKLANMDISWEDVPMASWNEKVNVMIASGNLPDAFCGQNVDVMQNLDLFTPLGDYVKEVAPHIQEMLDGDPAVRKAITAPDGKIYSLPTNKENPSNAVDNMIWMNPDWLKKVGKSEPKTTDEFVDVLRAFKNTDLNGNGKHDEIPFQANEVNLDYAANLSAIIGAFGALLPQEYVYSVDHKNVVFGGTQPGLKDALNWLHQLYSEKLLDNDVFTMTNAQQNAKAQNKDLIIGSLVYWIPDSMDSRFANYEVLDPLKGPKGDQLWLKEADPIGLTIEGFTVTKACKDPEALIRYYDSAMKDLDTLMEWQWGPKGGGLWKPVGTSQWTQTQEFVPQGTNLTFFKRTICGSVNSPNAIWSKYASQEVPDARNKKKRDAAQKILPLCVDPMPKGLYDPEKVTARNLLFTDIDNYMKKFFATSVVNGVTDQQWQQHLDNCKKLKTDEYTKMWQEYFTDYNARK
jgi:ABC-type sugar transport system, periplasmic component